MYVWPVIMVFAVSFVISLFTLLVYLLEADFSDKTLLYLLSALKYSSFLVGVSSVYLLIAGIYNFIRRPSLAQIPVFFLFILGILYGAGIIVFYTFIITIYGGNL